MEDKFEVKEPVKVNTRYLGRYEYFDLPDEVLFWTDWEDGTATVLWHGCLHTVPFEDVFKLDEVIPDRNIGA